MAEVKETVVVGEKEYRIVKTGRAQAEQVASLTKWLSRHGVQAIKTIQAEGNLGTDNGLEFVGRFVGALDADALIDLYIVLIGCSKEDAEVYFDVATLVDVALAVYEQQPSLRRLLDRFFSIPKSEASTDVPSTTSEPPTDGQTTSS